MIGIIRIDCFTKPRYSILTTDQTRDVTLYLTAKNSWFHLNIIR